MRLQRWSTNARNTSAAGGAFILSDADLPKVSFEELRSLVQSCGLGTSMTEHYWARMSASQQQDWLQMLQHFSSHTTRIETFYAIVI